MAGLRKKPKTEANGDSQPAVKPAVASPPPAPVVPAAQEAKSPAFLKKLEPVRLTASGIVVPAIPTPFWFCSVCSPLLSCCPPLQLKKENVALKEQVEALERQLGVKSQSLEVNPPFFLCIFLFNCKRVSVLNPSLHSFFSP